MCKAEMPDRKYHLSESEPIFTLNLEVSSTLSRCFIDSTGVVNMTLQAQEGKASAKCTESPLCEQCLSFITPMLLME